jgi:hypothetical protein
MKNTVISISYDYETIVFTLWSKKGGFMFADYFHMPPRTRKLKIPEEENRQYYADKVSKLIIELLRDNDIGFCLSEMSIIKTDHKKTIMIGVVSGAIHGILRLAGVRVEYMDGTFLLRAKEKYAGDIQRIISSNRLEGFGGSHKNMEMLKKSMAGFLSSTYENQSFQNYRNL